MSAKYKYIFGPVPSRRLGRSLGLDIIPFKTCTQNCLYCQLGTDADTVIERAEYVDISLVIDEFKAWLAEGLGTDVITISGSGEPTLNSGIGRLISEIKKLTDTPVVVITNGTLLWDPEVRSACSKADIVMPSLDACDAETFEVLNKPHPSLNFDRFVQGLKDFRKEFSGRYWLEVFLIEGINTSPQQIAALSEIIKSIGPDRTQVNTAVRPTSDVTVELIPQQRLHELADMLDCDAEEIASFARQPECTVVADLVQPVIDMLIRRPCSLDDICAGLSANRSEVIKAVTTLLENGQIGSQVRSGNTYYTANPA